MYRGDPKLNVNGGVYRPGRRYDLDRKIQVGSVFIYLADEIGDENVTISDVAKRAKVSWHYARDVIKEYREAELLSDPMIKHEQQIKARPDGLHLHVEEEVFLLSLRAEKPNRTNVDYVIKLFEAYNRKVTPSFISRWFKNRFENSGNFRKPNLVPLDKWRPTNVAKYFEYRMLMEALPLHHKWCFIDEKHLVNKDAIPNKVRANPLTGKVDAIAVSGDFRKAYNMIAIISANPEKEKNIEYYIDTNKGDAVAFYCFINELIQSGWFHHDEVLVMDNAAIHTGGVAVDIVDILWNTEVDGRPLNVFTIFLPTRSPELNPIELIFHILSRRLRSYRYELAEPMSNAVVVKTAKIFDDIDYELILKCYIHCGY